MDVQTIYSKNQSNMCINIMVIYASVAKADRKSKLNPYSTKVGRFLGWHRAFIFSYSVLRKHIPQVLPEIHWLTMLASLTGTILFVFIFISCVCAEYMCMSGLTSMCLWAEGRDHCKVFLTLSTLVFQIGSLGELADQRAPGRLPKQWVLRTLLPLTIPVLSLQKWPLYSAFTWELEIWPQGLMISQQAPLLLSHLSSSSVTSLTRCHV